MSFTTNKMFLASAGAGGFSVNPYILTFNNPLTSQRLYDYALYKNTDKPYVWLAITDGTSSWILKINWLTGELVWEKKLTNRANARVSTQQDGTDESIIVAYVASGYHYCQVFDADGVATSDNVRITDDYRDRGNYLSWGSGNEVGVTNATTDVYGAGVYYTGSFSANGTTIYRTGGSNGAGNGAHSYGSNIYFSDGELVGAFVRNRQFHLVKCAPNGSSRSVIRHPSASSWISGHLGLNVDTLSGSEDIIAASYVLQSGSTRYINLSRFDSSLTQQFDYRYVMLSSTDTIAYSADMNESGDRIVMMMREQNNDVGGVAYLDTSGNAESEGLRIDTTTSGITSANCFGNTLPGDYVLVVGEFYDGTNYVNNYLMVFHEDDLGSFDGTYGYIVLDSPTSFLTRSTSLGTWSAHTPLTTTCTAVSGSAYSSATDTSFTETKTSL